MGGLVLLLLPLIHLLEISICCCWTLEAYQALAEHKSSFPPLQVLIICAVIAVDFLVFSSQPGKVAVAGVGELFQTSTFRGLLSAHDVGALMTQCWMGLQRMSSAFFLPLSLTLISWRPLSCNPLHFPSNWPSILSLAHAHGEGGN